MDAPTCKFFKFGYCYYGAFCRKKHVKEICEKVDCEINDCTLRHPRKCKFFIEFGRCKFGEFCSYSHSNVKAAFGKEYPVSKVDAKIQALEISYKDLLEKMKTFEAKLVKLKKKNATLEKDLMKVEALVYASDSEEVSSDEESVKEELKSLILESRRNRESWERSRSLEDSSTFSMSLEESPP